MRDNGPREDRPRRGPFERYSGPLMTLHNMRQNGVRSLAIRCDCCYLETILKVDQYAGDVPVPAFGPRMVCTVCGMFGAVSRPNCSDVQR